MGALIDALLSRGSNAVPTWIDERVLVTGGVAPWTELPLWISQSDRALSGFMEFAGAKAQAYGLRFRPLAETLDDTAAWLLGRDNSVAWAHTLSAAKERLLLAPD